MKKNNFACNLQSDLFKVKKLKSVWIALAIMFGLILLGFSIYWLGENSIQLPEDATVGEQIGAGISHGLFSIIPITYLFGSVSACSVELFVAIIASIFIGKDFSNGAIALAVARGAKRRNIYFSKFATMTILVVIYSAISLILGGIFAGISDIGQAMNGAAYGMLFRNFFMQVICGISAASIFIMIAFLTRSSGNAIATTLGSYILISVIISLIAAALGDGNGEGAWVFFMPFNQMLIASAAGEWNTVQIVAVSVMPVVYIVISTLIGCLTFEKRDIK